MARYCSGYEDCCWKRGVRGRSSDLQTQEDERRASLAGVRGIPGGCWSLLHAFGVSRLIEPSRALESFHDRPVFDIHSHSFSPSSEGPILAPRGAFQSTYMFLGLVRVNALGLHQVGHIPSALPAPRRNKIKISAIAVSCVQICNSHLIAQTPHHFQSTPFSAMIWRKRAGDTSCLRSPARGLVDRV